MTDAEAAFPGQPFFVPMLPQPEIPQDLRDAVEAYRRKQDKAVQEFIGLGPVVLATHAVNANVVEVHRVGGVRNVHFSEVLARSLRKPTA